MLQSNSFGVGCFRLEVHFLTCEAAGAVGRRRGEERNWECVTLELIWRECALHISYEFQ